MNYLIICKGLIFRIKLFPAQLFTYFNLKKFLSKAFDTTGIVNSFRKPINKLGKRSRIGNNFFIHSKKDKRIVFS